MRLKHKRYLRNFIKFIIVIICISAILSGLYFYDKVDIDKLFHKTEEVDITMPIDMESDYAELKQTPSDIDGKSQYDKLMMGLNPVDGSDTDGDGLTDKEELAVYGSDPKKKSTAGDLYSDGYKIAHNMDVNTYAENTDEITFENNECEEIVFDAGSNINNLSATAQLLCDTKHGKYDVIKGYRIYNYEGRIMMKSPDTDGYKILIGYDNPEAEFESVKFEEKDGYLDIEYDFLGDYTYKVLVAKKEKIKFFSKDEKVIDDGQPDAHVVVCALSDIKKMGMKPKIYYCTSGDTQKDHAMMDEIIDSVKAFMDLDVTYDDFTLVSREKLEKKRKGRKDESDDSFLKDTFIYDMIEKVEEFKDMFVVWVDPYHVKSGAFFFLAKYDYADVIKSKEVGVTDEKNERAFGEKWTDENGVEYETSGCTFNVNDTFPFYNFSSEIMPGHCAGISLITAQLYNGEPVSTSGESVTIDGSPFTWDITCDAENETLVNPYLNDYKSLNHFKDKKCEEGYVPLNSLTQGEQQFFLMMADYNNRVNDAHKNVSKKYGVSNYNWELIEDMIKILKNKKVLLLGLSRYGDNAAYHAENKEERSPYKQTLEGHEVIVYDYSVSEDRNSVVFFVYDSNGTFLNKEFLTVWKKTSSYDHPVTFEYFYKPMDIPYTNKPEYIKNPDVEEDDKGIFKFEVNDEKLRLINDLHP